MGIYNFIYTNTTDNSVSYLLLYDDFRDYLMDSYDWDVDSIESIDTLFQDGVLEWENYIYINCHTDVIINVADLTLEIDKICSDFMDGKDIERLMELIGD
ncbi:hypothetical protein [Clostridium pasteurianum]|uniref:Uncharacterized protein n=1 Tax=Clostridium pasteurianum BC1 TaxID=86416 RepID=R4K109_CLOPA|nr:hypothetical protein [Clostridium pasteurianum]AGK96777.1 hypothetical protein Clopa_1877 [Clostridium pasteurianum BC1]